MKNINLLLPVLLLITSGCTPVNNNDDYEFTYETIIKEIPVNLEPLNTIYDDYNSDLPYPAARSGISFSTNRNTSGGTFDIIFRNIDISYHKKDEVLNFSFPDNDGTTKYQTAISSLITNEASELGPLTLGRSLGWDYFFYSTDEGGDFDIRFVYTPWDDWGTYQAKERLYGPVSAVALNSDSDDIYPAFNSDQSKLYFCSNRTSGQFDIFSFTLDPGVPVKDLLTVAGTGEISRDNMLSSSGNDKCPSITNNLLVFASDREGGFGGFDLYYSLRVNGEWTSPVNFGIKINSEFNEYRPIAFSFQAFDLMIFSSDRPEGKGGYDLYSVIIDDLIDNWLQNN